MKHRELPHLTNTIWVRGWVIAFSFVLILAVTSGCASYLAQKRLQGVAKGWCQMIRASQVIPVYPLTEDLQVGDVFLVQTPISEQASEYNKNGFLPLDDAQVRLGYTNFSSVYFDSYWKDEFGNTPHTLPLYTNAGPYTSTQALVLTQAPLPRAAFPTYSFQASSGFGFNAAFPIEGVPVALSYLNSQQVNGEVTISDARTYAGDTAQLLALLTQWAGEPGTRDRLAQTAINTSPKPVFLRVVSRIYFVRAVDISLQRTGSQGASGKGGSVNDVNLATTNGNVLSSYTNLLGVLNSATATAANAAANATQVGAALKVVSASGSTIGLSQSFDRLLAFGYLGFDVPVYTNGDLGTPIPTFQHIVKQTVSAPKEEPKGLQFAKDENTAKIRSWLANNPSNIQQLQDYIGTPWMEKYGIEYILDTGQFSDIRSNIVVKFNIK